MKKVSILIVIIAGLLITSCSKKGASLENAIPDEAFAVMTIHPKQIFDKGQVSTLEFITENVKDEFLKSVIENPLESGIEMNEYTYLFVFFISEDPVIGVTAALADDEKFRSFIDKLMEKSEMEVTVDGGYSMILPEKDEAAMAWNSEQMIFMASPEEDHSSEEWKTQLMAHFDLPKEENITSIVDYNDFSGKMKDMNLWFTGDEFKKIMDMTDVLDDIDFDIPLNLMNNYVQLFADFQDGAMYLHSETHFSDDVTKAAEEFLVAKDELNKAMMKLTPGNNLLMAMAMSLDLEKMSNLMNTMSPPEMDGVTNQIEQITGVAGKDIVEAMSGDFVVAINGAEAGTQIPIEVTIGIGLDDESLQEKLLETAGNMASVEKDGDFFMINANGIELYSGIVDGIWVLSNAKGYKDAVTGSGLDKDLLDSKFSEFAGGAMGMYLNMDISTYPAQIQGMLSSGGAPEMLELVTSSLTYLAMEASNSETDVILKTAKEDENSLYTILQMMEKAEID